MTAAQKDTDSILVMWKHMLRLRKEHRGVLVYGMFEIYNTEHLNVFTYVKLLVDLKVLVVSDFSSEEQDLEIPPILKRGRWSH